MLYAEWFKYESLQPRAIWLAEFCANESKDWFLEIGPLPKQVYFIEEVGLCQKTLWEWQRFYTLTYVQPWNLTEFRHNPAFVQGYVFEVGTCYFATDSKGRLIVEMFFGTQYGRGYLIDSQGHIQESWAS